MKAIFRRQEFIWDTENTTTFEMFFIIELIKDSIAINRDKGRKVGGDENNFYQGFHLH